ncbi:MAG: hypothetical protein LR015_02800 [Verrucomicrobia bacterium]|nr:hypothetical protein [Verrucomicrobiota bacterium]
MTDQQKPRVTLEQLLQIKRCEKPAPEFWDEFDRKLKSRSLQALVEKPSFWARLPRLMLRAGLIAFPVGATALLSFILIPHQEAQYGTSAQTGVQLSQGVQAQEEAPSYEELNISSSVAASHTDFENLATRFVVDAMPNSRLDENRSFRAVMHTPLMTSGALSAQGTVYVVNPLHRSDSNPGQRAAAGNF